MKRSLLLAVSCSAVLVGGVQDASADVYVSTWEELKNAVASGSNETVYLNNDIQADVSNPITAFGSGIVIDGQGQYAIRGDRAESDKRPFDLSDAGASNPLKIQNIILEGFNVNSDVSGAIQNNGNISEISGVFVNNNMGHNGDGTVINNLENGNIDRIAGSFSNNVHAESDVMIGGTVANRGHIGSIEADFTDNRAQVAAAVYNYLGGAIDKISGNFINNATETTVEHYASLLCNGGGAVYNAGTINEIVNSVFEGNRTNVTQSTVESYGGAILNMGTMTIVNSVFYDNMTQEQAAGNGVSNSHGGAIYNANSLTIRADNGVSEFRGNHVRLYEENDLSSYADKSNAIYSTVRVEANDTSDDYRVSTSILKLEAVNNGVINIDDGIEAYAADLVPFMRLMGYDVAWDSTHTKLVDDSGKVVFEPGKIADGYVMKDTSGKDIYIHITENDVVMEVDGDETGRVNFNGKIETMGTVNVKNTNVYFGESSPVDGYKIAADSGVVNNAYLVNGGNMTLEAPATANITTVGAGGELVVKSDAEANDTEVLAKGSLTAEDAAKVNNLVARNDSSLNIDAGAQLKGDIVIEKDAQLGGSFDYKTVFEDADKGSLTLVGGLNPAMNEALENSEENKVLNLEGGTYTVAGTAVAGATTVSGWDRINILGQEGSSALTEVKLAGDLNMPGNSDVIAVSAAGELDTSGETASTFAIGGTLENDGIFTLSHEGDDPDDVTHISGDYKAGSNAQFFVDVDPMRPKADMLEVDGDVSGSTNVTATVSSDAQPGDKILFVSAPNDDLATGAHFHMHRVIGSPYVWNIGYENNNWYMGTDNVIPDGTPDGYEDGGSVSGGGIIGGDASRLPSVVAEIPAYIALPNAGFEQLRGMTGNLDAKLGNMDNYYDRRDMCSYNDYNGVDNLYQLWVSPVYRTAEVNEPVDYEADVAGVEFGADLQSDMNNRLGVFMSYRQGQYDLSGEGDEFYSKTGSEIDIDSYVAGLYYRYSRNGAHLTAMLFGGMQSADIQTDDGVKADSDGWLWGGALRAGYAFDFGKGFEIEPLAGVSYTDLKFDDVKDNVGKTAVYDNAQQIEAEAAVRFNKRLANGRGNVYLQPGVVQVMTSGGNVNITGLREVESFEDELLYRLEIGANVNIADDFHLFGTAVYTFNDQYKDLAFQAGFGYSW